MSIRLFHGTLYINNSKYDEFVEKCNQYEKTTCLLENKDSRGQKSFVRIKKYNDNRLHLRFIYFLLTHKGTHVSGNIILKLFLKIVLKLNDSEEVVSIKRERRPQSDRYIDLLIERETYKVAILINIYKNDFLSMDDIKLIENSEDLHTNKKIKIYYLTVSNNAVIINESRPYNKMILNTISFKKEIIKWLNECQYELKLNSELYDLEDIIDKYKKRISSLKVNKKYIIKEFEVPYVVLKTQPKFLKEYLKKKDMDGFFDFEFDEYTFYSNSTHWFNSENGGFDS